MKLTALRQQQSLLKKEIMELRDFILSKGSNPYPFAECAKRNKAIYHLRRTGLTYREIAARYKISVARARGIYVHIEDMVQRKRGNYRYYLSITANGA